MLMKYIKKITDASEKHKQDSAKNCLASKKVEPSIVKNTLKDLSEQCAKVWNRSNAIAIRNGCSLFAPSIFPDCGCFEEAFGKAVSLLFASHGNWRIWRQFPEIHITFLEVDVYHILNTWNRRDINLKAVLLNELRQAYTNYARSKGWKLENLFPVLITGAWLVGHTLILEIPDSSFSVQYPVQAQILAAEEYWKMINMLNQRTAI